MALALIGVVSAGSAARTQNIVHAAPEGTVLRGQLRYRVSAGSGAAEGAIGDAKLERPLVLGHEFAGETEDGQRCAGGQILL